MPLTLSKLTSPAPPAKQPKQPAQAPSKNAPMISAARPEPKAPYAMLPFLQVTKVLPWSKPRLRNLPLRHLSLWLRRRAPQLLRLFPSRVSISSKGKGKEMEMEPIRLSPTPEPINVQSYIEPKKCANPDTLDGGRVVQKQPTDKPKTSMPAARSWNQAMDLVTDRLLKAVNPGVAQEAASVKQMNNLNNRSVQNQARKIA